MEEANTKCHITRNLNSGPVINTKHPHKRFTIMRQKNAYLAPVSIFLGIAYYNLASAMMLILSKASSASSGWLWRLSILTWIVVTSFVVFQTMICDFLTSPYPVPDWWIGFVQLMNFVTHFFSMLLIAVSMLTRLSVFYKRSSTFMIGMGILFFVAFGVKAMGDYYGVLMSISVMNNEYLRYEDHPYNNLTQLILAINSSAEGLFTICGSLGFLSALNTTVGGSKKNFFRNVLLKHEGYRLILVIILYGLIAGFLIYGAIAGEHTNVTHTGIYLGSWAYALELRTFLELSYVSAKEIILQQAISTSKDQVSYDHKVTPQNSKEKRSRGFSGNTSGNNGFSGNYSNSGQNYSNNQQVGNFSYQSQSNSGNTFNNSPIPMGDSSQADYMHYNPHADISRQSPAQMYNQESMQRGGYSTHSIQRHVKNEPLNNTPQYF